MTKLPSQIPLQLRRRSRFKTQVYCHKLIMETAKEMMGSVYEDLARGSNEFYAMWPDQDEFVRQKWGLMVAAARTTLAAMLQSPIDEGQKNLIHEALVLDAPLAKHRTANTRLFV
jgi:hypothetical protein